MLRRPSAAFTWLGKAPPTAPAAMPAPVACMNDRRDHLPCRTRLAPSYVMSVSSGLTSNRLVFLEFAQQPRRNPWGAAHVMHSTTALKRGQQPKTECLRMLSRNVGPSEDAPDLIRRNHWSSIASSRAFQLTRW